jgi:hypothetical protein
LNARCFLDRNSLKRSLKNRPNNWGIELLHYRTDCVFRERAENTSIEAGCICEKRNRENGGREIFSMDIVFQSTK